MRRPRTSHCREHVPAQLLTNPAPLFAPPGAPFDIRDKPAGVAGIRSPAPSPRSEALLMDACAHVAHQAPWIQSEDAHPCAREAAE